MIEKFIENNNIFTPTLGRNSWVHSSAVVVGKVLLEEDCSVWPCAVIRGDVNNICIGRKTNIQDGSIVHATHPSIYNEKGYTTEVGEECTIGHNAILHGCNIGNRVLVGMAATILDGSIIDDDVIIGANSLVPMNKKLRGGYLYLGSPVKIVRKLKKKEIEFLRYSAKYYSSLKDKFQKNDN